MTRAECEDKIKDLFNQILDVYKEYNPDGKYLTASLSHRGDCSVNSAYFPLGYDYPGGAEYKKPIDIKWKRGK